MKRFNLSLQILSILGVIISIFILSSLLITAVSFQLRTKQESYLHYVERLQLTHTANQNFYHALSHFDGALLAADSQKFQTEKNDFITEINGCIDTINTLIPISQNPKNVIIQNQLLTFFDSYKTISLEILDKKMTTHVVTSDKRLKELTLQIEDSFTTLAANRLVTFTELERSSESLLQLQQLLNIIFPLIATSLGICITTLFLRKLRKKLQLMQGELTAISNLDLRTTPPLTFGNDELGDVYHTLIKTKSILHTLILSIQDKNATLQHVQKDLATSAEASNASSTHIATSIQTITSGISKNAENIASVSAFVEQLSSSTEEIASSAADISSHNEQLVASAQEGNQMMVAVTQQNTSISNSMTQIVASTTTLQENSSHIQQITNLIENIASQTNLLALNATIEAARAGEAGSGFAVVANAIRTLAEESRTATSKINTLLHTMQKEITLASQLVAHTSEEVQKGQHQATATAEAFQHIIQRLTFDQESIAQISLSIHEAAKALQDVAYNVQDISTISDHTTHSAEDILHATTAQKTLVHTLGTHTSNLQHITSALNQDMLKFQV